MAERFIHISIPVKITTTAQVDPEMALDAIAEIAKKSICLNMSGCGLFIGSFSCVALPDGRGMGDNLLLRSHE